MACAHVVQQGRGGGGPRRTSARTPYEGVHWNQKGTSSTRTESGGPKRGRRQGAPPNGSLRITPVAVEDGKGRGNPRPASRARSAQQRHGGEPPNTHHRNPPVRRGPGTGRGPPAPAARTNHAQAGRGRGGRPREHTARGQSQGEGGDPLVRQLSSPSQVMPSQEGGHLPRQESDGGAGDGPRATSARGTSP